MKKVNNPEHLPTWFNLANYKFIKNLTHTQLYEEIRARAAVIQSLKCEDNYGDFLVELNLDRLSKLLELGGVSFSDNLSFLYDTNPHNPFLSTSDAFEQEYTRLYDEQIEVIHDNNVRFAKISTVEIHHKAASTYLNELLPNLSLFEQLCIKQEFDTQSILHNQSDNEKVKKRLLIEVELNNCVDKDLIEQFKELLDNYRRYTLPSDVNMIKPKPIDLSKVKIYKLIELSDLIIWGLLNNKYITYHLVAVTLWPDNTKGEEHVKQTIKPLFDKIFNRSYFKSRLKVD